MGSPPPRAPALSTARPGRRPLGSGRVDTHLIARTRPVAASREQVLPAPAPLAPLLPGGIRRGSVLLVEGTGGGGGATTLAVSLLATACAAGSWGAVVGLADPGVLSIAELGVDLGRLVLVPRPSAMWPEVTATFLQGMDLVLLRPPGPARPDVARRLAARAREQRTVLVVLTPAGTRWPEGPDLRLGVEAGCWQGVGSGHGHLRARRVVVTASGRRAAAREARAEVWLPGPTGAMEAPVPAPGEAEERCGAAVAGGVVPRSRAGRGAR
ncbi:MAG TPA: hypothetical protein VEI83_01515 [Acidimicrobiales bacterium]|nr:hypothetical protein [Acidimicrobiales bacterium]